ncbi:MAG: hypothetical protein GXY58_03725 [Planctomycetaceae bacterium]|nr:hypothetical protein [Planctomycetaceae bacterium]
MSSTTTDATGEHAEAAKQMVAAARTLHSLFYPPGIRLDLTRKMHDGVVVRHLLLHSERLLDWLIRPVLLAPLVIVGLRADPTDFGASMPAVAVLAWIYTMVCSGALQLGREFLMHVQVAPHLGGVPLANQAEQRASYARVRRWLEMNRLAGERAIRWVWDRRSRRVFDHLYEVVTRRANGWPHSELESTEIRDEDREAFEQVLTLLEEVPQCAGAIAFVRKYWLLVTLQDALLACSVFCLSLCWNAFVW